MSNFLRSIAIGLAVQALCFCALLAETTVITENISGLNPGQITSIAKSGAGIYACGSFGGGVFKYDGSAWSPYFDQATSSSNFITSMTFTSDNKLLCATANGLYLEGKRIYPVDTAETFFQYVFTKSDGTLYASGPKNLYRSTDNGKTWSINLQNLNMHTVQIAEYDAQTMLSAQSEAIYFSTNSGNNWQKITFKGNFPFTGVAVDSKKNIFLIRENQMTQTTFDDITSYSYNQWSKAFGLNVTCIALDDKDNIWIGTKNQGIWMATDSNHITKAGLDGKEIYAIKSFTQGRILAATSDGAFAGNVNDWTRLGNGLTSLYAEGLGLCSGGNTLAFLPTGEVNFSYDGSSNWSNIKYSSEGSPFSGFCEYDQGKFLTSDFYTIYKGQSGSTTLTPVYTSANNIKINSLIDLSGGIEAAATGDGILLSPDRGVSWSKVSSVLASANVENIVKVKTGNIYALADGKIVLTGSANQINANTELPAPDADQILLIEALNPNDAAQFLYAATARRLYGYDETSQKWILKADIGNNDEYPVSIVVVAGNPCLVTNTSKIVSPVGTYQIPGIGITVNKAYNELTDPTKILLCTNGLGIFRCTFMVNDAEEITQTVTNRISPVPASDYARINLNLDHPSQVFVRISNMSGETVKTIEPDYLNPDAPELSINCSDFAQGVYSVIISADDKTFYEKLIVAR